jgi:prefoldin subunit 5
MSDSSAKQIQMLNEYIAALERQIKSIQTERESLFQ